MRHAAAEVNARLREQGYEPTRFLVQPMFGPGVELLVGVLNHPVSG